MLKSRAIIVTVSCFLLVKQEQKPWAGPMLILLLSGVKNSWNATTRSGWLC